MGMNCNERYSKKLKINEFFVSVNEKAFYICTRIQRRSDETHWRNGRAVECGSLENY
jgi:hypothetical protein